MDEPTDLDIYGLGPLPSQQGQYESWPSIPAEILAFKNWVEEPKPWIPFSLEEDDRWTQNNKNLVTDSELELSSDKTLAHLPVAEKAVCAPPSLSNSKVIQLNDFGYGEKLEAAANTQIAYSNDFRFVLTQHRTSSDTRPARNNVRDARAFRTADPILPPRVGLARPPPTRPHSTSRKFENTQASPHSFRQWVENVQGRSQKRYPVPTRRRQVELPLVIHGSMYLTCPDSGSHENIIAKSVVQQLGISVDEAAEYQKEFRIGNGKIVKSTGRVSLTCSFAKDPVEEHTCWFYVFTSLIKPIIIGMAFLDATETLTKFKSRLHYSSTVRNGPLQLFALNNPAQRLRCMADGNSILANADTGSEIDLVSLRFSKRRSHRMQKLGMQKLGPREEVVQFADGSKAYLAGKVSINFGVTSFPCLTTKRTFYVLQDLTSDMIVGDDFLYENDAFETYKDALTCDPNEETLTQLNTIVWLKTPEKFFGRRLNGENNVAAPEPLDAPNDTDQPTRRFQGTPTLPRRLGNSLRQKLGKKHESHEDLEVGQNIDEGPRVSFEERMESRDARELFRREQAQQRIAALTGEEARRAKSDEIAMQEDYEEDKKRILRA